MIALVQAITTQPVAITPHQVIKVIATPIGPNPVHPWSNIGKPTRTTAVMTIPSITTPAKPASRWYFQLRPPSRTSNIGVSDQKIHTGTSDTTRSAARTPASCWPVNPMRSWAVIIPRYRTNQAAPRQLLGHTELLAAPCLSEYCGDLDRHRDSPDQKCAE